MLDWILDAFFSWLFECAFRGLIKVTIWLVASIIRTVIWPFRRVIKRRPL